MYRGGLQRRLNNLNVVVHVHWRTDRHSFLAYF